ncbi:MAG: NUDIX domain-containing protein [Bacteroidales bacterium]|nr:NUDIX domain-containing protein [Bacteroidales bacterium]
MVNVEQIFTDSEPGKISYVVIAARHRGGWLFVRHRRRGGYELPAGHPEPGEDTVDAAVRELTEETGACGFVMEPVTYYSVDSGTGRQYGRLFYAEVDKLGDVSDTSEIEAVKIFRRLPRGLSLPEVMTFLWGRANEFFRYNRC